MPRSNISWVDLTAEESTESRARAVQDLWAVVALVVLILVDLALVCW